MKFYQKMHIFKVLLPLMMMVTVADTVTEIFVKTLLTMSGSVFFVFHFTSFQCFFLIYFLIKAMNPTNSLFAFMFLVLDFSSNFTTDDVHLSPLIETEVLICFRSKETIYCSWRLRHSFQRKELRVVKKVVVEGSQSNFGLY